jgi:YjbR
MDVADAAGHPMHFAPQHPLVVRVRALCLAYPEAVEAISHGRCTFRAGKRQFAIVGSGSTAAVEFVPDESERFALIERDDVFVPPYEGAYGWLALRITPDAGDWKLLAELLDTSYRQVALQRQLRALDGAGRSGDTPHA